MKKEQQRVKGREVLPFYKAFDPEQPLRSLTVAMLRRMNIPEDYWRVGLEKVSPDQTKKMVTKYLVDIIDALEHGIGMIINGEYGSGKTSIAILCLKQARRNGGTGLYLTAAEYLRDVFQRVRFDDTLSTERRAAQVDLLVIDDLGKEAVNFANEKDASAAMFVSLVKERASKNLSTIVTTNLLLADMGKFYGESFIESFRQKAPVVHTSKVIRTNEVVRNFFAEN